MSEASSSNSPQPRALSPGPAHSPLTQRSTSQMGNGVAKPGGPAADNNAVRTFAFTFMVLYLVDTLLPSQAERARGRSTKACSEIFLCGMHLHYVCSYVFLQLLSSTLAHLYWNGIAHSHLTRSLTVHNLVLEVRAQRYVKCPLHK
jgi:hypothetical protein